MFRFKIGDKVRIRGDIYKLQDIEELDVVEDMVKYKGMEATILGVIKGVAGDGYYLDIDNKYWIWYDDLLLKYDLDIREMAIKCIMLEISELTSTDNGFRKNISQILYDYLNADDDFIIHYYNEYFGEED